MSEWVALLIDRATQEAPPSDRDPAVLRPPHAAAGATHLGGGPAEMSLAARAANSKADVASYQALVQKKKLTSAVPQVKTLPDSAKQAYEAPPFWAR